MAFNADVQMELRHDWVDFNFKGAGYHVTT
jgi:hypothetical protein